MKIAKYLLDRECWDNSAYLAGYVIECTIKAVITTPQAPAGVDVRAIGHNVQALAGQLGIMAASRRPGRRRSVSGVNLVDSGILRERYDGRFDTTDLYMDGLGFRRKGGVRKRVK